VDIIADSSMTVVSWAVANSDGRAMATAAMMRQGVRTANLPETWCRPLWSPAFFGGWTLPG
jgi:hypothetical protein